MFCKVLYSIGVYRSYTSPTALFVLVLAYVLQFIVNVDVIEIILYLKKLVNIRESYYYERLCNWKI